MDKIRTILASALSLLCLAMSAQSISTPYEPGITRDAVSYWLPKTKLTVTVTVQKQTYTPGEFSRYAERYLRLSNANNNAQEVWSIKSVEMTTCGIPDKDHLYTLTFPDKGPRPYVELTSQGIIQSVNVHSEQPISMTDAPSTSIPTETAVPPINPLDLMTEEILMAGSTAKMAELTAKEIYNIRESRNAITRGQSEFTPTDGESLKYMLELLSVQESALLTMFSGTNQTEEDTFTIDVTPNGEISKQILFRFSSKLGVLPIDNLAGEPVWIDITDYNISKGYADNATPSTKSQKKAESGKSKKEISFLYYRLPGRAHVKIYNNRISFREQDLQMAQFGSVEVVSSTIMGKHYDTKIIFDPITGNVLSINE